MIDLHNDIDEILITEDEIREKIQILGSAISDDYENKDLVMISILKGGLIFLADLLREVTVPANIDFMAITSYGTDTESTGIVQLLKDLSSPILGKEVLIVEDIIDTGLTLNYLIQTLKARQPLNIKICSLMDKSVRRIVDMPIAYKGFDVPDQFVVGYGLDYGQKYRNLPYIGVLKEEIYH